jgi:hypothetical protein
MSNETAAVAWGAFCVLLVVGGYLYLRWKVRHDDA